MWPFAPRMNPPVTVAPAPCPVEQAAEPSGPERCGWCREPIPATSVSGWFCGEQHQRAWQAANTPPWTVEPTIGMTYEQCTETIRARINPLGGAA